MECRHISRFQAFTLAEVLFTITIIGIIAGMVIPEMIINIRNQDNIVRWKRTYSTFAQAIKYADLESFEFQGQPNPADDSIQQAKEKDFFKKTFNIMRICEDSTTIDACWHQSGKWSHYDGTQGEAVYHCTSWDKPTGCMVWDDSGSIPICTVWEDHPTYGNPVITAPEATCDSYGTTISTANYAFIMSNGALVSRFINGASIYFYIDINSKKSPNVLGKDIFSFQINNDNGNGNYIYLIGDGTTCGSPLYNSLGYDCAKYYLFQ